MLIKEHFVIIHNLQTSPIPQTSFLVETFFATSCCKTALGIYSDQNVNRHQTKMYIRKLRNGLAPSIRARLKLKRANNFSYKIARKYCLAKLARLFGRSELLTTTRGQNNDSSF